MATPSTSHALSGHNPTLFDVVIQYADMDMLRALVLTSQSMYDMLQHCRFDHLTMVVLEAPILEVQQQIIYNGADPVPADTFHLPLDAIVAPSCQAQTPTSALPDNNPFHAWEERSAVHSDYDHNFTIPDYARNFMARAQSVELVVYRRRLGTRISAFFTDNALHLKHGRPADRDECTHCVESKGRESAGPTPQYELHLPCLPQVPQAHSGADDQHIRVSVGDSSRGSPSNDCCVFSKHPSVEFAGGGVTESCRLMAHMFPGHFGGYRPRDFPFDKLPSLQLKLPHHTPHIALENDATPHNTATKHIKTMNGNTLCSNGHLFISTRPWNRSVYRPRFHNLPPIEHDALTTSLKIRLTDCISFGAEDWCSAIPGCAIQPVQTWMIWDDISAPDRLPKDRPRGGPVLVGPDVFRERIYYITCANLNYYRENSIGRHFPRLSSLVLQYSCLYTANACGSQQLRPSSDFCVDAPFLLSHFFIDGDIRMPHLQHFGVIGTLLSTHDYASIAFYNERITSLTINPLRELSKHTSTTKWIHTLSSALDKFERSVVDDIKQCEPPHQLPPLRKYNFSIDYASSILEGCCPNGTYGFGQKALVRNVYDDCTSERTQYGQQSGACDFIYDTLSKLCSADTIGSVTTHAFVVSLSLSLILPVPTTTLGEEGLYVISAICRLTQRTLTYLTLRCHYCSHANPGTTLFPGASPGDCTATRLASPTKVPLGIGDLTPNDEDGGTLPIARGRQPDEQMYMRLRELLRIPPHVVLRL